VRARSTPGAPNRHDLPNLFEAESKVLRLLHERHDAQGIRAVHAVAGCSASCGRQDVTRLVHAKCLAAYSASLRKLTAQQAIASHGRRIRPAPRGKVKGLDGRGGGRPRPPGLLSLRAPEFVYELDGFPPHMIGQRRVNDALIFPSSMPLVAVVLNATIAWPSTSAFPFASGLVL
jgi:hypothetical protein